MPLLGTGNPSVGAPFAMCEYEDWGCTVVIPASGSIPQGSVLYRDSTALVGESGQMGTSAPATLSDICVLGNSANAAAGSPAYGVYQGPTITNPSSTATLTVTILVRRRGQGVVLATAKTAGTAVTVNGSLIGEPGTDQFTLQGAAALNKTIGVAAATGAVTALGASLIAVPGSGQTNTLINAFIDCK